MADVGSKCLSGLKNFDRQVRLRFDGREVSSRLRLKGFDKVNDQMSTLGRLSWAMVFTSSFS